MSDDDSDGKKKKKKSSFKSKLFWFLAIITIFVLTRQAAMIMLVGMLPTLVVKFIDDSEDGVWFKTIFCFNLAGVYPFVIDLVMINDASTQAVQDQMADSMMWLIMYGAAGAGYLAMWFFPTLSEFFMRVFNTNRIERHTKKLKRLHDEWGVGDMDSLDF